MSREETTNWLGGYVMRFDGTPDLSNCYAQVSDNGAQQQGSSSSCSVASGPAQKLKLLFSFFGFETFAADVLLTQPVQPMSYCPKPPPAPVMSPPHQAPPPPEVKLPPSPPKPQVPVLPPPQAPVTSPPPATSPPHLFPPVSFSLIYFLLINSVLHTSLTFGLCDLYRLWIRPEYRCYWRVIGPDTKVAVAFGLIAGRRYGTDMTVREALDGRGEAYKTLLREATTALLNSYNSLGFPYNSIAVITHTNLALLGNSQHDVLMTAIRFIKANSGTCKFTVCK
ncbi:BnaA07g03670D [Brassica napus]|uniref:BnaA07g03670D protein n=1 Tax=Brassica napus TaxID=3708 RepID=A0A078IAI4_BRANA|nr:BnaA07g03670D [Brassica napus]